ncbi:hypothetical protein CJ738_36175, partial [Klebsiella pneumoniae]
DIDIERGGAKLIRIRDNGSGIKKTSWRLALARHATSKIASLDIDIERGGAKLIRIRDNGSGIKKTSWRLALAR